MNIAKKRFLLLGMLLGIGFLTMAQQVGSNSPYGRYGYGLLSSPSMGASEAMGGISYGIRRSQQVNPMNPASYSKLDSLTFIFDFGISGQMARFGDGNQKHDYYNGNLDYAAIQFPLFRKMGASIGLLPFSKVGYNYGRTRSLSDIIYQEAYRGSGGLNQIYAGLAYEPVKYLSVGANVSYLFGNFYYSNVITPLTSSGALIGEERSNYSIRDIKYDFGAQFIYPVDKESQMVVGAVYSPKISAKSDLAISNKLYTTDPNSVNQPERYLAQVLRDDTLSSQSFELPHTFGLGFTYSNRNFLLGLDGTLQQWKGIAYSSELDGLNDDTRFNNTYKISAGGEYVIDPYSRDFWSRLRMRAGVSYANSYTNINVQDAQPNSPAGFNEYSFNLGFGIPFRDNVSGKQSMLNVGFGYIMQRPERENMIKQDLFKISVNMNVNELWFFKRQFN